MTDDNDRIAPALAGIADPSGRGSLAESGRIAMTRLKEGKATVVLDATGLSADQRAQLERQVRAAMIAVEGVEDTRVAMTAERLERMIVAIGSGKGGVGKSTVSANIAVALARMGKKVGLVDADIYGPSQPRIMGQAGRPEMIDEQIVPLPAHGVRMLSMGQLIEPGTAVAWRGPMTASAFANLMDADWGDCEILIVDLPPGTGDIQMSLIQKWKPAGAVIVSTPQDLSLMDATRAIDMFRKMDVEVIGLVENMAGYACPHCGEVSDPFGTGGAEAAAGVMSVPFLGRIPLIISIRRESDAGRPPAAGDGDEAALFRELAQKLLEQLNRKAS
ncbi:Mrp/NBP35 family ATP-binding protein [Sphingosinicella sp. LHD-64]|uniref:Mrp/NBP35 family ATP-binding protein n=1 Tax=Sphingosinicella sp. LHD-64 TaxID=3072139 RepID=UPI00280F7FC7|nr:Mrp/NBP35 family ATP-binding protein [Sphingosinicella sp. LHD-64]MDQ8756169.1 Mrp/NBP35 family ATP-binding protein [Sphingosinicella sp. LHD-64]